MYFERLKKAHIPIFHEILDPEQAEKWISELESNFKVLEILEEVKAMVAKPFFVSKVEKWYKSSIPALTTNGQEVIRNVFKNTNSKNSFSFAS